MKIKKFITSLLPTFEKGRVTEDIALLKSELKDQTLPIFKEATNRFVTTPMASSEAKKFDRVFNSYVKMRGTRNYIETITKIFENLDQNYSKIETAVARAYGSDISVSGMTYLRANLLQYIEAVGFSLRYSRRLLIWTIHQEQLHSKTDGGAEPMSKAEIKWFEKNQNTFLYCMRVLNTVKGDLDKVLADIPDMIIVPEDVEAMEKTVGNTKLDPMNLGIIPIAMNPIYHIRMAVAEWQVNRYNLAKEERKLLELKLLSMKESAQGNNDPKLQQNIEYTEGRLQKLNRKLAEMEDDING